MNAHLGANLNFNRCIVISSLIVGTSTFLSCGLDNWLVLLDASLLLIDLGLLSELSWCLSGHSSSHVGGLS